MRSTPRSNLRLCRARSPGPVRNRRRGRYPARYLAKLQAPSKLQFVQLESSLFHFIFHDQGPSPPRITNFEGGLLSVDGNCLFRPTSGPAFAPPVFLLCISIVLVAVCVEREDPQRRAGARTRRRSFYERAAHQPGIVKLREEDTCA